MAGSDTIVTKFAGLQERLYASEQSNEWSDDDFNQVLELLGSDAETPLMIRLRSFELVGKYSKHFPALLKNAFGVVLAQYNAAEATQKQSIAKFVDGMLKPVSVTVDGNTTTVSVVHDHGAGLLQQKFEAGDEEAAKTSTELLTKMGSADPKGMALVCTDVLHEATEEKYREFVMKYLVKDVLQAHKKALAASPESEMAIKDRISTLLHDVNKDEFTELLKGLTGLKIAHNKEVFGPQGIVDILSSLIDTSADVDLENAEWMTDRTLGIIQVTCPFFGEGVQDRVLMDYLVNKWVVPENVFGKVSEEHSVQILHRLCDVAKYCSPEVAATVLPALWSVADKHIPQVVGEDEQVEVNYTFAEAFLYVLGELGGKAEEKFAEVTGVKVRKSLADAKAAAASTIKTKEEIEAEKSFKERMTTLVNAGGKLLVQVQAAKKTLTTEKVPFGDAKFKEVIGILRTIENVIALAKPLAESYAHFGSVASLSWRKPAGGKGKGGKGGKGKAIDIGDGLTKKTGKGGQVVFQKTH
eukprot:TRINITY_DN3753_c0_g1_i1.p1 TRINITY_DN3753_c0_g1~~TRINITY_DN3753_c0_g1_i1.p1  ORF type:complete len:526 (+),score=294.25 TRINITY_DN3753_c0_g1_i1:1342-2919(+)